MNMYLIKNILGITDSEKVDLGGFVLSLHNHFFLFSCVYLSFYLSKWSFELLN